MEEVSRLSFFSFSSSVPSILWSLGPRVVIVEADLLIRLLDVVDEARVKLCEDEGPASSGSAELPPSPGYGATRCRGDSAAAESEVT